MEEMFARAAGFGLAIDFEIDVLEDVRVGRAAAIPRRKSTLASASAFASSLKRLELLLGQDFLRDELALEELDGIVLGLVFLDLLGGAVAALVLRVGDGVAVVAIGVELDDRRLRLIVRALDGLSG